MLRGLWNRLVGRNRNLAVEREAERERMSPDERRFAGESIDDIQADAVAREHLGAVNPEGLLGEDERPRH